MCRDRCVGTGEQAQVCRHRYACTGELTQVCGHRYTAGSDGLCRCNTHTQQRSFLLGAWESPWAAVYSAGDSVTQLCRLVAPTSQHGLHRLRAQRGHAPHTWVPPSFHLERPFDRSEADPPQPPRSWGAGAPRGKGGGRPSPPTLPTETVADTERGPSRRDTAPGRAQNPAA